MRPNGYDTTIDILPVKLVSLYIKLRISVPNKVCLSRQQIRSNYDITRNFLASGY